MYQSEKLGFKIFQAIRTATGPNENFSINVRKSTNEMITEALILIAAFHQSVLVIFRRRLLIEREICPWDRHLIVLHAIDMEVYRYSLFGRPVVSEGSLKSERSLINYADVLRFGQTISFIQKGSAAK